MSVRRVLGWGSAVPVLLLAALAILVASFDWNRIRPLRNERVSTACGPVTANGAAAPQQRAAGVPGGVRRATGRAALDRSVGLGASP